MIAVINLAGMQLEHPIMNGAGTCKIVEDVAKLANSSSAAIVLGSITMESRPGNSGNVYWANANYSLNSLGLPNPGRAYYRKQLPEMVRLAHDKGKPLIVSVAGFSPKEYADLAETALEGGADAVEVNLGCPNLWSEDGQKPIVSFYPDLIVETLDGVAIRVGNARVGAKLSPFSNPLERSSVADRIVASTLIKFLTLINTFPNAFDWAEEQPAITASGSDGYAGLAGPALKPIAQAHVRLFRSKLPVSTPIIGAGGVSTGGDVRNYRKCGAIAVQVATAYANRTGDRREAIFSELLSQFIDHISAKQ